jgi:type I restriction enzyme S subunit
MKHTWPEVTLNDVCTRITDGAHHSPKSVTQGLPMASKISGAPPSDSPPLPTQHKIAAILSAYDDLIENNTRRIAILEEMAQALYREWFVHFRFPGHEGVRMVESELGPVPERWKKVELEELYRTSSGGTPSRKVPEYYDNGTISWLKTRELNDGFILGTEEKITELGLRKSSAKLFPPNTVIMAMYGATIGKLGILAQSAATNQACCAIMPRNGVFRHAYVFFYLLQNREKLISLGMGAAQQNISQQVIKKFEMLKPTNEIVQEFNSIVDPILESIRVLQAKNANLRQTRDLLLPRLISGEPDVSGLEVDTEGLGA